MKRDALYDLHIHTKLSDGNKDALDILEVAKANELEAVSFTDHHTTRTFDEATVYADYLGIELIPGTEISTSDFKSLHILGYGMDDRAELNMQLKTITQTNQRKIIEILLKIEQQYGKKLFTNHQVKVMLREGNLTRKNIAHQLVKMGLAKDAESAYSDIVGPFGNLGVQTIKPSAKNVIESINSAGGVAVVAHPRSIKHRQSGHNLSFKEHEQLFAELKSYGLQGIEAIHQSDNSSRVQNFFKYVANNQGLIKTGGSDYHGHRSGESIGNPNVKEKHMDSLRQAIKDRHNSKAPRDACSLCASS